MQLGNVGRNVLMTCCGVGLLFATACTYQYERTYQVEEKKETSALPCFRDDVGEFLDSRLWSKKEATEYCTILQHPQVGINGLQTCANNRKCSDEALLPYQPCAQPMPTYYSDLSATEADEGIVLIHPVTRTQVLCFDTPTEDAVQCAENFRASGYVLITDVPQLPARYDFLRKNTYPTRRWRDGGEVVPRW